MKGINLLRKHQVEFNILTVVNKYVARNIRDIYQFFKQEDYKFLQFIEVLDTVLTQSGKNAFSLNNKDYYKFLKDLFILWYNDFNKGNYISIRFFDSVIHKLLGNKHLLPCFYKGVCQNQNVIEANGDLYSCDFYVVDQYKLGNIFDDTISNLMSHKTANDFIKESNTLHEDCKNCQYYYLCRNGCKRYRVKGKYVYCEVIYRFYDEFLPKFQKVAEKVKRMS